MARDEHFNLFILITLLLDIASSLHLSKETAIKNVDDDFIVVCKDNAGLPVAWKGPKGRLGSKTHPRVQQGSYGTSIVFNRIKIGDAGNYTCTTTGSKISRIFRLIVEESKISPEINVNEHTNDKENDNKTKNATEDFKFENDSRFQIGIEGQTSKLQCKTNLDKVDTTWSLANGEAIKNNSNDVKGDDGFVIRNVSIEDTNVYTCQSVHTDTGRIIYKNITFVVHHKPYPLKHYAQENVVYGFLDEPLNLTCEVTAVPPPSFRWLPRKVMGKIVEKSSHKTVLQINVTENTKGDYKCIASNSVGTYERIFEVNIGVRPDPPENVTLVGVTPTSLEISIQTSNISEDVSDAHMEPTMLLIEYRPESKEDSEWIRLKWNISADRGIISDLEKNTMYDVRVATENNVGIISEYFYAVFGTSLATSIHMKSPLFNILVYLTMLLTSKFWLA